MGRRPTTKTPPGERPAKATGAQITQRLNQVYKLMVMGKPRPHIIQYCSETWQIDERQADNYIARVRAMLDEQAARTRDEHRALALQRLDLVFSEALDSGEYKDALGAQHQVNKIIGLYAPTNVNHSGSVALTWEQMIQQAREDVDGSGS
jgi:hypothetical protein